MKIGLFAWQPGLLSDEPESAGGAQFLRYLMAYFRAQGHEPIWLTRNMGKPTLATLGTAENVDVAYIMWRWEMPDYPERNEMYVEQMQLIEDLHKLKRGIIVHDQDHKISGEDMKLLKKVKATLTAPELFPRKGFKSLMYPTPFFTHGPTPFKIPAPMSLTERNRIPFLSPYQVAYVGNVYERYEDAKKFFVPCGAEGVQVEVWGNWLEEGPDRPGEKQVRKDFPLTSFHGRISQKAVVETLAQADTSIHLSKETYAKTGFMAHRWAESAAAATPAFIPSNFRLPTAFREKMKELGFYVKNGEELAKNYLNMTEAVWTEAYFAQNEFIHSNLRYEPWIEFAKEHS